MKIYLEFARPKLRIVAGPPKCPWRALGGEGSYSAIKLIPRDLEILEFISEKVNNNIKNKEEYDNYFQKVGAAALKRGQSEFWIVPSEADFILNIFKARP